MNGSSKKTNGSGKNPSQRSSNEKNERATVDRDIKNSMDDAFTKSSIDGDPTRSDE